MANIRRSPLSIFTYLGSESLAQSLQLCLNGDGIPSSGRSDRYLLTPIGSPEEFLLLVEQEGQQPDCLVLQDDPNLLSLALALHRQGMLLPLVVIETDNCQTVRENLSRSFAATPINSFSNPVGERGLSYHPAAVFLSIDCLDRIPRYIDRAIARFIALEPAEIASNPTSIADTIVTAHNFLPQQQRRLTEKLRERLGYLGVYYKRNPDNFFRYLPSDKKQKFLEQIKSDYRQIVLTYFSQDNILNQKIDEFVNTAFFSDIPVTQIVEIHMELMDEFSKQLKLEGRSEDLLMDYRLTLIDVIAHLCEMYRRSIPKDS